MGRDGGVRSTGAELAREAPRFRHALMLLDFHGCGREHESPLTLEATLDGHLQEVWGERAKSLVIFPEVDVWLWGADNVLRESLHWSHAAPIRDWLRARGFEFGVDGKPRQPKEAIRLICRAQKLARSSALYERITSRISLQNCTDPAFARLREQLSACFGVRRLARPRRANQAWRHRD